MESHVLLCHQAKRNQNKTSMLEVINIDENNLTKKSNGVTEKDQMNIIIKALGTPSDSDLSFMNDSKRKAFLNTYEKYSGKKFSSIFPSENDDCIHLIK